MPSRRDKILEELGLLADEPPSNPYQTLGIDLGFAHDLLREDTTGEALRVVATGMYRLLSRRYHSDIEGTSDPERFRTLSDANQRIDKASPAALVRWTKPEASAVTAARSAQQQERLTLVAQRAAELVRVNMELGQHPQHFSQLGWSQGILLRRDTHTLLMRQNQDSGLQVVRGETFSKGLQAFDFQTFMRRFGSFGIEPDAKMVAYIDETGQASILTSDLGFVMDITDPVAAYREQRRALVPSIKKGAYDAWSRSADPVLLVTRVPGPATHSGDPEAQVLSFPAQTGNQKSNRSLTWLLPMEVAGTFTDVDFYRRIRHDRAVGTAALQGARGPKTINYFSMAAIPTSRLIEQEAGYSPLIAPGNSLLLYDPSSHMPVVTNAEVVGMIGNGAQY